MKHIFVMNPAAPGCDAYALRKDIFALWPAAGVDFEIYETRGPGDGEAFVRRCCAEAAREEAAGRRGADPSTGREADGRRGADPSAGKPASDSDAPRLRFYACGGDGTLNEVVNGAAGVAFAEVGCVPLGTGNDFVRNFPEADFTDMLAQLRGEPVPCDLIRYESVLDGRTVRRYGVNMFNIGFDCAVVDKTDRLKRIPLLKGSLAYLSSIAVNLIEKRGETVEAMFPDGSVYCGDLLLITVANGCFCGGGIKGLPRARTDDGKMDISMVQDVPRLTFARFFPKYREGTHLEDPRLAGVVTYRQETGLIVAPTEGKMKFCVDGEVRETEKLSLSIEPGAISFVVPKSKGKA